MAWLVVVIQTLFGVFNQCELSQLTVDRNNKQCAQAHEKATVAWCGDVGLLRVGRYNHHEITSV